MNEPSTQVFTHVIVFHDGSHRRITQEQHDFIIETSCKPDAKTVYTPKLGLISFSAIARIPEAKDYYDQFPDKRPYEPPPERSLPPTPVREMIIGNDDWRKKTIEGLKRSIAEAEARGEDPLKAKDFLASIELFGKGLGGKPTVARDVGYWQAVVNKYKGKELSKSEQEFYDHALKRLRELGVMS